MMNAQVFRVLGSGDGSAVGLCSRFESQMHEMMEEATFLDAVFAGDGGWIGFFASEDAPEAKAYMRAYGEGYECPLHEGHFCSVLGRGFAAEYLAGRTGPWSDWFAASAGAHPWLVATGSDVALVLVPALPGRS